MVAGIILMFMGTDTVAEMRSKSTQLVKWEASCLALPLLLLAIPKSPTSFQDPYVSAETWL